MAKNNNNEQKKEKRKIQPKKILTSIIAGLLCLFMLLSVCGTLIAYLVMD